MKRSIIVAGLAALYALASPAYSAAATAGAAAPPAAETMAVPGQVTIVLPNDIKWVEGTGSDQALLWGDPSKPGPYGYLIRWKPGSNSQPHSHDQDRFAWVISGTWWNSDSRTPDKSTMRPAPAGSFVKHAANQVHWDGARDEPTVLLMTGVGPMKTTQVR